MMMMTTKPSSEVVVEDDDVSSSLYHLHHPPSCTNVTAVTTTATTKPPNNNNNNNNNNKKYREKDPTTNMKNDTTASEGLMWENDSFELHRDMKQVPSTLDDRATRTNATTPFRRRPPRFFLLLPLLQQRLVPVIHPNDRPFQILFKQCIAIWLLVILPGFIIMFLLFLLVSLILIVLQQHRSSSQMNHPSSEITTYGSTTNSDSSDSDSNIIRVAFIGNSITFVNDLPRLMESFPSKSNHKMVIQQNSCLHSSLSFVSILSKGNGMYNKWKTSNALIQTDSHGNHLYDFGACTVRQLLFGYDKYLSEGNSNGHYSDDGTNPCFQQDNNNNNINTDDGSAASSYYEYLTNTAFADYNPNNNNTNNYNNSSQKQQRKRIHWDYIVMNDQTVQPGIAWKRKRSIRSLKRVYAKLVNRTKTAIPILLSTYGYDKSLYDEEEEEEDETNNDNNDDANDDDSNVADANYNNNNVDDDGDASNKSNSNNNDDVVYNLLGDIPEFTSRIWYGYQLYHETLSHLLPIQQQPILVPSALAFLLVYEENYNAWLQLFYNDGFHPSPHGTYLLGCCLYASMYQQMPLPPTASSSYFNIFSWFRQMMHWNNDSNDTQPMERLFQNARRMHTESMGDDRPYPTVSEAMYLYQIAERVVLQKYIPKSLLSYETVAQMEANE